MFCIQKAQACLLLVDKGRSGLAASESVPGHNSSSTASKLHLHLHLHCTTTTLNPTGLSGPARRNCLTAGDDGCMREGRICSSRAQRIGVYQLAARRTVTPETDDATGVVASSRSPRRPVCHVWAGGVGR